MLRMRLLGKLHAGRMKWPGPRKQAPQKLELTRPESPATCPSAQAATAERAAQFGVSTWPKARCKRVPSRHSPRPFPHSAHGIDDLVALLLEVVSLSSRQHASGKNEKNRLWVLQADTLRAFGFNGDATSTEAVSLGRIVSSPNEQVMA